MARTSTVLRDGPSLKSPPHPRSTPSSRTLANTGLATIRDRIGERGRNHLLPTTPFPRTRPRNNGCFRDGGESEVIVRDFPSGRSPPHRLPHLAERNRAISGAVERVTTRALSAAIIDDLRRIASDRRKNRVAVQLWREAETNLACLPVAFYFAVREPTCGPIKPVR